MLLKELNREMEKRGGNKLPNIYKHIDNKDYHSAIICLTPSILLAVQQHYGNKSITNFNNNYSKIYLFLYKYIQKYDIEVYDIINWTMYYTKFSLRSYNKLTNITEEMEEYKLPPIFDIYDNDDDKFNKLLNYMLLKYDNTYIMKNKINIIKYYFYNNISYSDCDKNFGLKREMTRTTISSFVKLIKNDKNILEYLKLW